MATLSRIKPNFSYIIIIIIIIIIKFHVIQNLSQNLSAQVLQTHYEGLLNTLLLFLILLFFK